MMGKRGCRYSLFSLRETNRLCRRVALKRQKRRIAEQTRIGVTTCALVNEQKIRIQQFEDLQRAVESLGSRLNYRGTPCIRKQRLARHFCDFRSLV
jgi:hypothetical protein